MKGNIIRTLVVVSVVAALTTLSACNKEKTEVKSSPIVQTTDIAKKPETTETKTEIPEVLYKDVAKDTDKNYIGTVNGEKITQTEYRIFLNNTKFQMESNAQQQGTTDMKKFWSTPIEGKDAKEYAKDETLKAIKGYKTQMIQVAKDKYKVSADIQKEIDKKWAEMVFNNGEVKGITKIINERYGVGLDDYKKFFYNYSTIDNYIQQKQEKLQIPDKDVTTYYEKNKDKYNSATVIHVLFSTIDQKTNEPLSKEKVAEAKKKADDTLIKINKGEDPKKLAKALSEDPGVTKNSGEYVVKKGQMVKEFEDFAFSKKVGDTGIVKTQYGYHVIKKTNAGVVKLEEAKAEILTTLKQDALKALLAGLEKDPLYDVKKNEAVYKTLEK